MKSEKGILLVVSGPAGSGKGTILKKVRETHEFVFSVSATTRAPRQGEVEGVDYFFKTPTQFEEMIKDNEFLEWVTYCDNYYGTLKSFVMENITAGRDMIIEVDIRGALRVKENFPESVLVFILPPSFDELNNRIKKRGTETEQSIKKRLNKALEEFKAVNNYDYIIVNDRLDEAVVRINSILTAEKQTYERKENFIKTIIEEGLSYERS